MNLPTSSTAATPIGDCPRCGGVRYANMTHYCGTAVHGWRNTPYREDPPPTKSGWTCPACGRGVAWWMPYCDHGEKLSGTTRDSGALPDSDSGAGGGRV